MKTHTQSKAFRCGVCQKPFAEKHQLDRHAKQHQYPTIQLYKPGEARLQCTPAAKQIAKMPKEVIADIWLDPVTAEAEAKRCGNDLWKGNIVISFGKYAGQTFKWLAENDVGWTVWMVDEFRRKGDKNQHLCWLKNKLLEYVEDFPAIHTHLEKRLKVSYL